MMGSNRFRSDMPHYVNFHLDGHWMLDEMISTRLGRHGINMAFDKMKAGEIARSALVPLVARGRLHPERIFSDPIALSEGALAYRRFDAREDGVLNVLLDLSK